MHASSFRPPQEDKQERPGFRLDAASRFALEAALRAASTVRFPADGGWTCIQPNTFMTLSICTWLRSKMLTIASDISPLSKLKRFVLSV
ncbi:MAG: hypothetical protein LBR80_12870 [Deltaproteobacteria bacterium]|jgi:hypothetical protein|nr:hypothetical protein [Deltaproteobacteria bacterium]